MFHTEILNENRVVPVLNPIHWNDLEIDQCFIP
jgi:hypothetical protein